ncbi:hypothetical protein JXB12_08290 [candidate division KSB1 bacterium]|nr:hypothetical protein [candidate division KSB1 bacterium]
MRNICLWLLAFVITISVAILQRLTGPTYPVRGKVTLHDNTISFKLPRTHGGDKDHVFRIHAPDRSIRGEVVYKRYKTNDEWTSIQMFREETDLVGYLPHQPPAGKLEYKVHLTNQDQTVSLTGAESVVIRFKGHVPISILIPHIITIFAAMLMSTRTGLEALHRDRNPQKLTLWTIIFLFVGGIIFGPLVQKYAFGVLWAGFPFGHDLTDNKTLIAFVTWLVAYFISRRRVNGNGWIVLASATLLVVFLIPHSLLGSELDYSEVDQACISFPFLFAYVSSQLRRLIVAV